MTDWGRLAAERLAQIARISETGRGVTRLPYTEQHRAALKLITEWMKDAGLGVHLDHAGTLTGRHNGQPGAGVVCLGSHQDSVREGGAYDGIMGVLLPILAIKQLREQGMLPRYSVEVLCFADEEGVRWPTALLGSRALAGTVEPEVFGLCDSEGVAMRAAMEEFGLDADRVDELARNRPGSTDEVVRGFVETHIEQGPVLEDKDCAVGLVTGICGIERQQVVLTGETGHAGTLPMASRRDALVGAANMITEVNRLGCAMEGLRATVGELHLSPNVVNAVPREVRFTIELRSPDDRVRQRASAQLQAFANKLAQSGKLSMTYRRTYAQAATPADKTLSALLGDAIRACGQTLVTLPSGATHDASAMAELCPIAMLFVRCRDGVSHTPDEFASADDMGVAVQVLVEFLLHCNHEKQG